ncbi:hypothetical protein [Pseudomonas songnenensis]
MQSNATNPSTGGVIETKGGNHKGLKGLDRPTTTKFLLS